MRELTSQEIEEVNGGAIPVIVGLVAAAASHAGARSLASYAITRIGSMGAMYSAAQYFGGSGY